MGNPLVSSYKGSFVAARLFATATGGVRWPPDSAQGCSRLSFWLLGFLLFWWPLIVGGILLDNLVRQYVLDFICACGLFSGISFLFVIIAWLIFNSRRRHAVAPENEKDDFSLIQSLSRATPFNYALLYAVAAALLQFGVQYLNFWLTHREVVSLWSLEMVVRYLLWITDCIAMYSLAVQSPIETATFQIPQNAHQDSWHQPLMRPFYLTCLVGIAIFLREVPVESMNHFLVPFVDAFICLLPLLWLLGILAPLDALKLWFGEWVTSTVFGGSPTVSELSLYTKLLASLVLTVICFYARSSIAVISCAVDFLLSIHFGNLRKLYPAIHHCVTFTVCVAVSIKENSVSRGGEVAIVCILVVIFALSEIYCCAQKVTIAGGLISNPFWSNFKGRQRMTCSTVTHLVLQGVLIHFVCPPMMCWILTSGDFYQGTALRRFLVTVSLIKAHREVFQYTRKSILVCIVTVILRNSNEDLMVFPLCVLFALVSVSLRTLMGFFERLYTVTIVLFSCVFISKQRLQHNWVLFGLNIILFPWMLFVASITAFLQSPVLALFSLPIFIPGFPRPSRFWPFREHHQQQQQIPQPPPPQRQQQQQCSPERKQENRPREKEHERTRLSEQTTSVKSDVVFYAQFIPRLIAQLENSLSRGLLGATTAGSCFLARHQNRLVFFRVIEAGFLYRCIEAKGLELQETSCHTLEAAKVDEIIEDSFLKEGTSCVNPHAANTFRPRARTHVVTYSSARNVLTGVIDQPAFFEALLNNFSRVLLWVLLHHQASKMTENNNIDREDVSVSTDMLSEHSRYRPRNSWWSLLAKERNPFRRYPSRLFIDSWMAIVAVHVRRTFPGIVMPTAEEPSLCVDYRQLCDFCYRAVFPDETLTPALVNRAFNGNYSFDFPDDLHGLVQRAVQFTTKLAIDTVIISEAETERELARILESYDTRWFIGVEGSHQWNICVKNEVPYMFSIAHDPATDVYTSHLLSLILDEPVYVGTLSGTTVDTIWSTLSLELLYMTNDDDERYSIQAHPWLLRNLTIQSADPPLGYPLYIDQVRYLTTLN